MGLFKNKHLCPTCSHAILNNRWTFNEETCVTESDPIWHCEYDHKPREHVAECENYDKRKTSVITEYA